MIIKFLGASIVAVCLVVVFLFEHVATGDGAFRLLHWPAIILTGIGPLGLILLCSARGRIRVLLKILGRSSSELERQSDRESVLLQEMGRSFYGKGVSSLETFSQDETSPALRRALGRLVVRMPIPDIREIVEREREKAEERTMQAVEVLRLGVRLTPSIGMLGTILGMVRLLSTLRDPSEIGSSMSLALLTTFYGLFFSLVLWTPLEQKAQAYADAESANFEQISLWLELLERRKPAQYLQDETEHGPRVAESRG